MKLKNHVVLLISVVLFSNTLSAQSQLSLFDYGWGRAKDGADRAQILYAAQSDAITRGSSVDYSGIKKIEIEITSGFKSIPLTGKDDFNGVEFVVTNNSKDIALFALTRKGTTINVDKRLLDGRRFHSVPELQQGEHLLIITDNNLWVDNRVGYNYGHTRKDILLIKDGESLNEVIAPYNNAQSAPACSVVTVPSSECHIGNFIMTRAADSKYKTYCLKIQGAAHLTIENIVINTPESDLKGDRAINIIDCADVTLKNITINNTYSQPKKFGYGISINNAWNTYMVNVKGTAPWGLLGNNNMSDTYLMDCQLNRFDIHCYGKNVYLADCKFDGGNYYWYCGGSSIYGLMKYDRCSFINCTPIAFGDSYKTAVGLDVVFNDCVFNATKKRHSIFATKVLNDNLNPRLGLSNKCLPNIEINNMTINVPEGVKEVLLYDVGNVSYSCNVDYLQYVKINGLVINQSIEQKKVVFKFINVPVRTDNKIIVDIVNLSAPFVRIDPVISSNRRNKVKISDSSFLPIEASKGLRLSMNNCRITQ